MKDIEETIKEKFEEVKNEYYRPPIDGPTIIKNEDHLKSTAFLDWLTNSVGINVSFIEKLSKHENIETIIEGLFTHEFGHYVLHPRNLTTQIYLSYQAEKAFKEKAEIVYGLFTDFENNVLICREDVKAESLKRTLKATYQEAKNSALWNALILAYKNLINLDVEVNIKGFSKDIQKKIEETANELEQIIITSDENYRIQFSQLMRFGNAINPLLEIENNGASMFLFLYLQLSGANKLITKREIDDIPLEERIKIEGALKNLLKSLPKETYEEMKKHFLDEDNEDKRTDKKINIGVGSEDVVLADKKTIEYYRDAAKEFGIYIKPRRTKGVSATPINFGKEDFRPDRGVNGIELTYSGGKIIPGLTKIKKKEKVPYLTSIESLPTLLIYKDASGSMVDPSKKKCYATIAGTIFLLSYLRSGANVGISLFDSSATDVFYSRKEEELLTLLCGYKGGGTKIDIEKLKKDLEKKKEKIHLDSRIIEDVKNNPLFRKYLKKSCNISVSNLQKEKYIDLVIITDGGISNINDLIKFMKDNPNYRPTIIHTSDFEIEIKGYDQKTSGVYEGISILKGTKKEDIIDLAKQMIKRNLLSKYYY